MTDKLKEEAKHFEEVVDNLIDAIILHEGMPREAVEPFIREYIKKPQLRKALQMFDEVILVHELVRPIIADKMNNRKETS